MKLYTLKVDNGDNIENIWSGNEMSDAIHYEDIAVKHWGRDAVWICNNMDEIAPWGYSCTGYLIPYGYAST